MRICIYGAGAVGGHIAARLSAAGSDVSAVATAIARASTIPNASDAKVLSISGPGTGSSGRVALIGVPLEGCELPLQRIVLEEMDVFGVRANPGTCAEVIPLIAAGRIDVERHDLVVVRPRIEVAAGHDAHDRLSSQRLAQLRRGCERRRACGPPERAGQTPANHPEDPTSVPMRGTYWSK